ncbi:putative sporulation protein YtxC [Heyndrickxia acidiproducens]|uniref:putative sporulation protein YtxC n=1 Tax=Heyndrickxia acidiproducens TaxID=1121084 RepID=UPI0003762553|nr:putative sporulation protein YtxC [Heyndrickxia acidiproducens]
MELIFKDMEDAFWVKKYLEKKQGESLHIQDVWLQNQKNFCLGAAYGKLELQQAVIDFIVKKKRNEWIRDKLENLYYFKEEEEQNRILEIVIEMLNGERRELTDLVGEMNEPEVISSAVRPLFRKPGALSLDSFMTFRLKSYFDRLERFIGTAIDEYKMEQDYQVFIQNLRDYLKQKVPKKETIKLCFGEYSKFYNERFEEISKVEIDELIDRRLLSNHPVYIDSTTIAPLLSISPARIEIYTDLPDSALIRTICNIFEERVSILSKDHFWEAQAAGNHAANE